MNSALPHSSLECFIRLSFQTPSLLVFPRRSSSRFYASLVMSQLSQPLQRKSLQPRKQQPQICKKIQIIKMYYTFWMISTLFTWARKSLPLLLCFFRACWFIYWSLYSYNNKGCGRIWHLFVVVFRRQVRSTRILFPLIIAMLLTLTG